jgi:FkbM family methyltransferase
MTSPGPAKRLANQFVLASRLGPGGWASYRLRRLCARLFPSEQALISELGVAAWASHRRQRARHDLARPGQIVELDSKLVKYPLKCRAHTSDINIFRMILIDREYSCLDDVTDPGLIIDCGANVGYSSAYFLSRFPRCDLIAVEPFPPNFDVLRLNLAPYGERAKPMLAAVWSHPCRVTPSEIKYRSGLEASKQVRECRPGEEGGLPAVDVGSLLRDSGHDRISILKVDIEGAEAVVFSSNYQGWIDKVDNLVIEIHDDSGFGDCSEIFSRAIAGRGFDVSRCGELTVCKRGARGEQAGVARPPREGLAPAPDREDSQRSSTPLDPHRYPG